MKKMKGVLLVSIFLLLPLVFLTGCSKISLTGSATGVPAGNQMGTPPEGGIPPEGGAAPIDGDMPPAGAPNGAPAN